MITRATMVEFGTGREIEVEIWKVDKQNKTAMVSNWNYIGSGCWWDFAPKYTVDLSALINIRALCISCGNEFDPSPFSEKGKGKCAECGWDWRELVSDEQDGEMTKLSLIHVNEGG